MTTATWTIGEPRRAVRGPARWVGPAVRVAAGPQATGPAVARAAEVHAVAVAAPVEPGVVVRAAVVDVRVEADAAEAAGPAVDVRAARAVVAAAGVVGRGADGAGRRLRAAPGANEFAAGKARSPPSRTARVGVGRGAGHKHGRVDSSVAP